MILQCDQCSTKFRLDDSKLKPGGVKVRCSKCRHVFLAGADLKQEESEFDAILSGLGAPIPEKQEESPAAAPEAAGFDFAEEPAVELEKSAAGLEAPAPAAYQPEVSDFADFDFPEPGELPVPAAEQPSIPEEQDLAAFDFAPEPSLQPEAHPSTVDDTPEYGDFSFAEEPAGLQEEPASPKDEPFEFGELSFAAEPADNLKESSYAGPAVSFDFEGFELEDKPVVKPQEPPAALDGMDFGDFTFTHEPAGKEEGSPQIAGDANDFGEISFAEEAPFTREASVDTSDDFAAFSFSDELPPDEKPTPAAAGGSGLGEFSLSDDFQAKDVSPAAQSAIPVGFAAVAGPADPGAHQSNAAEPPLTPGSDSKWAPGPETMLDFDFDASQVPENALERPDDELPPLSISSRRKGRSLLTVSIVAVSVVVLVALSGASLYLLQSGPEAPKKLDQIGLGLVAKWFGMESPQEGRIVIRNPLAAFHNNAEVGELFVMTGEAVNSYQKARASIHVKVSLFDRTGTVLLQKTAYCGNRLSNEQLATLPMEKIESIMNNQFGDSLANLGVKPDQAIGFVVAIPRVPPNAVDFAVEVVGSTVAGQ